MKSKANSKETSFFRVSNSNLLVGCLIIFFILCQAQSRPLSNIKTKSSVARRNNLKDVNDVCATMKESLPQYCFVTDCTDTDIGIGCNVCPFFDPIFLKSFIFQPYFLVMNIYLAMDLHLCTHPPSSNFTVEVSSLNVFYQTRVEGTITFIYMSA